MISTALATQLRTQIGHEFTASHTYLGMSAYFRSQNLDGWANFFERQANEERDHALKIFHFLLEVGETVELPAIPSVSVSYESALETVQKSLQYEQKVTKSFQTMAQTAVRDEDFTGLQFLNWFLSEQIEEEATFEKLIALIESGINLFQAESLLPSE
jgi:ferritin